MNARPVIDPTPDALQRVRGVGRLGIGRRDGANRISALYQEGAARIRFPDIVAGAPLEGVLIATSGGLTGGDRMDWTIDVGPGASASLTTQASEKTYRSRAGTAEVAVRLAAGDGARLSWLPQETILFDRSALRRSIEADIAADSRLLLAEAFVFGRTEMGESVRSIRLTDRWRIRAGGALVHAEDFRVAGDAAAILSAPATGGGRSAFATLLLAGEDGEAMLRPLRDLFDAFPDVAAGASFWRIGETGKLLARLAAKDGYCLRKALQPALALLNGAPGLPKIWAT